MVVNHNIHSDQSLFDQGSSGSGSSPLAISSEMENAAAVSASLCYISLVLHRVLVLLDGIFAAGNMVTNKDKVSFPFERHHAPWLLIGVD